MRKKHSGPQIVSKLRQADILIGQGKSIPEIYEELDLLEAIEQDEQTYRPTRVLFYWPLGSAIVISFILALFSIPWASLAGRARLEDYDEIPESHKAAGS